MTGRTVLLTGTGSVGRELLLDPSECHHDMIARPSGDAGLEQRAGALRFAGRNEARLRLAVPQDDRPGVTPCLVVSRDVEDEGAAVEHIRARLQPRGQLGKRGREDVVHVELGRDPPQLRIVEPDNEHRQPLGGIAFARRTHTRRHSRTQ